MMGGKSVVLISEIRGSILTRLDHRRSRWTHFRRDKLVHLVFDQFAIHYPRFFHEHVAVRFDLRRLKKNIPWRTPVSFIPGELTVAVMRRLLLVFPRARLNDDRIGWTIFAEVVLRIPGGRVFADADNLKALRFV